MGCDGGTIPKRDELVKTKKKPEKAAKDVENAAKWNYCHLSQEQLRTPIVADLLGFIYNKEAIIEYLLERSKYEAGPAYVKSLKDIKELNLTPNPGYKPESTGNGSEFVDLNCSKWICPISGLEMNGVYKFYCIFSCGCVLSERAMKTMQSSSCLKCEKPYKDIDLIVLNAGEDDLDNNQEKYNQRKKEKAEKSKKTGDTKTETKSTTASSASTSSASSASVCEAKSSKVSDSTKTHVEAKKRDHAASIGSNKHEKEKEKEKDKSAKKVKTIQDDPNASEVYKSIFNTHETAKKQGKAHWVTYNPLFN